LKKLVQVEKDISHKECNISDKIYFNASRDSQQHTEALNNGKCKKKDLILSSCTSVFLELLSDEQLLLKACLPAATQS
jgi:hypothetical protein